MRTNGEVEGLRSRAGGGFGLSGGADLGCQGESAVQSQSLSHVGRDALRRQVMPYLRPLWMTVSTGSSAVADKHFSPGIPSRRAWR